MQDESDNFLCLPEHTVDPIRFLDIVLSVTRNGHNQFLNPAVWTWRKTVNDD
jgi:hypothetical protein